jgi:hypothetical protein
MRVYGVLIAKNARRAASLSARRGGKAAAGGAAAGDGPAGGAAAWSPGWPASSPHSVGPVRPAAASSGGAPRSGRGSPPGSLAPGQSLTTLDASTMSLGHGVRCRPRWSRRFGRWISRRCSGTPGWAGSSRSTCRWWSDAARAPGRPGARRSPRASGDPGGTCRKSWRADPGHHRPRCDPVRIRREHAFLVPEGA